MLYCGYMEGRQILQYTSDNKEENEVSDEKTNQNNNLKLVMNLDKRIIGENAGIIWRTLHNNKMSWEELLKNTTLNPLDLASGIGWLA